MTGKSNKTVLAVVEGAKKPKTSKRNGTGGGSGSGSGGGSGLSQHQQFGDYQIINGAFHQIKAVPSRSDGQVFAELPLCDFTCRIVEEITQDSGLEDKTVLHIEGQRQDGLKLPIVDVPATRFYSSQANWASEAWGTKVFIYPGTQKKDNLRAAIHLYSRTQGDIPRRLVHQYTGWKKIDGAWHYLSGSGAITENGLDDSTQVDLGDGHMARYVLPEPLSSDALKTSAGFVFDLLEICPAKRHIGAALVCAVARAPLGELNPTDFCLFLHGHTGSMKSTISAVALAFFGEFDARHFPANFSDTDNDMEAKSFQAKDSVFVIDDFKPSVNQAEASKLHSKAERLIRNTGNQAGRGRRGSDMQAKPAPYNRSMTFITGEDLPKGQSLLGRVLAQPLSRGDVDRHTLNSLQHAAKEGLLAGFMSSYLQWLAPRIDVLKKTFPALVESYRNDALDGGYASSHPRAPEVFANLVAGAEMLIEFMLDRQLVSHEQADVVLSDMMEHLKESFSDQAAYQQEQDETEQFLALLRASFASGNAHIACRMNQGPPPTRAHAWGWRSDVTGDKVSKPMGDCVGWYCDNCENRREVWFEQNAVFGVVQAMARKQGDTFLLSPSSLWRRMHDKGLIIATEARDKGHPRLTVKRVIGGRSRRVMILSADLVESE